MLVLADESRFVFTLPMAVDAQDGQSDCKRLPQEALSIDEEGDLDLPRRPTTDGSIGLAITIHHTMATPIDSVGTQV